MAYVEDNKITSPGTAVYEAKVTVPDTPPPPPPPPGTAPTAATTVAASLPGTGTNDTSAGYSWWIFSMSFPEIHPEKHVFFLSVGEADTATIDVTSPVPKPTATKPARTVGEQAMLAEAGRVLANSVMCSNQFKMFYDDFRSRQKGALQCGV